MCKSIFWMLILSNICYVNGINKYFGCIEIIEIFWFLLGIFNLYYLYISIRNRPLCFEFELTCVGEEPRQEFLLLEGREGGLSGNPLGSFLDIDSINPKKRLHFFINTLYIFGSCSLFGKNYCLLMEDSCVWGGIESGSIF